MSKIPVGPDTHTMIGTPRCPLCGQDADIYRRKDQPDLFEGSCATCGDVRITFPAVEHAAQQNKKHLVSAWLRGRLSGAPAEVLDRNAVDTILKDTPELSVLDKLDRTLMQISSKTDQPGHRSNFQFSHDFPLIYAQNMDEALFYIKELAALGYVGQDAGIAQLTAKGYQRLLEIQRASRQSPFAFVAMWFDTSMNEIYDQGIEPAVREAGYKPVRIDREQHANRIDDEIVGRIKGSRFMVADFSGQRAGVYFEAGMMLGLGRTVIWMCKKEELSEVHFDTRQYNFIDYATIPEAKKRLYDRIIAIEGEGAEVRSIK